MKKLAIVLALVGIGSGVAFAGPIEDREAVMKTFGRSLGALGGIAKGEKPYDAETVHAALTQLNEAAQQFDAAALFPEGTGGGETEASPRIWEDFAEFESKAEALKTEAAAALASPPTDQAGVQAQLGRLGQTCNGCHEPFRLKKG